MICAEVANDRVRFDSHPSFLRVFERVTASPIASQRYRIEAVTLMRGRVTRLSG